MLKNTAEDYFYISADEFEEWGDGVEIKCSSYFIESEILIIPNTFEGKKVHTLGNLGFANNRTVKTIVIENGIEYIQMEAFKDCDELETIILPKSIKEIDEEAFIGCYKLKHVIYKNGCTGIDIDPFINLLKEIFIYVPQSVKYIYAYDKYDKEKLKDIKLSIDCRNKNLQFKNNELIKLDTNQIKRYKIDKK